MAKGGRRETNLQMRWRVLRLVLLVGALICAGAAWLASQYRLWSPNELRALELKRLEKIAYDSRDQVAPLCVLGERHLADGKLDAALRAYATARDRDPNSAMAVAGYVLTRGGSTTPGWTEMVLRELTGAQPKEAAGYLALGQLYVQQGELDFAGEPLRRALELAPQDSEVLYQHGVWSGSIGATGQGIQDLEAACRLVPRVARYHVAVADLLIHLGRYEPAAAHLKIAEAAAPESGLAQYHLGRIRLLGKVTPEAAKDGIRRLERAMELSPGWDLPRLTLGRYRLQSGDTQRGIEELEAVLRSGNNSGELLAALAQGYYRVGRKQDGALLTARYNEILAERRKEVEEREAVAVPGPDRKARLLRRAARLRGQGRVLGALALYREVLALSPNDPVAGAAMRELTLQSEAPHGPANG